MLSDWVIEAHEVVPVNDTDEPAQAVDAETVKFEDCASILCVEIKSKIANSPTELKFLLN
jgi:hypothetical protein